MAKKNKGIKKALNNLPELSNFRLSCYLSNSYFVVDCLRFLHQNHLREMERRDEGFDDVCAYAEDLHEMLSRMALDRGVINNKGEIQLSKCRDR
jgi:hypothetical protein